MLKKTILTVLVLCLTFSIGAMADNTGSVADGSAGEISQQMPQGGRGNMGMPPSRDMQGRTPPNMPQGEFTPPDGFTPPKDFTPPQNAGEFTPPQSDVKTNTAETSKKQKFNKDKVDLGVIIDVAIDSMKELASQKKYFFLQMYLKALL